MEENEPPPIHHLEPPVIRPSYQPIIHQNQNQSPFVHSNIQRFIHPNDQQMLYGGSAIVQSNELSEQHVTHPHVHNVSAMQPDSDLVLSANGSHFLHMVNTPFILPSGSLVSQANTTPLTFSNAIIGQPIDPSVRQPKNFLVVQPSDRPHPAGTPKNQPIESIFIHEPISTLKTFSNQPINTSGVASDHPLISGAVTSVKNEVFSPIPYNDAVLGQSPISYNHVAVTQSAVTSSDDQVCPPAVRASSATVSQSADPSISASVGQSTGPSMSASVGQSAVPSISASMGQSSGPSISASMGQSISPSISASMGQSSGPSISASMGQSSGPSISASMGQSSGPSISASMSQSSGPSISASMGQSISPSISASMVQSASKLPSVNQSAVPTIPTSLNQSFAPSTPASLNQSFAPSTPASLNQSFAPSTPALLNQCAAPSTISPVIQSAIPTTLSQSANSSLTKPVEPGDLPNDSPESQLNKGDIEAHLHSSANHDESEPAESVSDAQASQTKESAKGLSEESKGPPSTNISTLHTINEPEPEVFPCNICGKEYSRKQNLQDHKDKQHGPDSRFQFRCRSCGQLFRHKGHWERHESLHGRGRFRCLTCQAEFKGHEELREHYREKHELEQVCPGCHEKFPSKESFLWHITSRECVGFLNALPSAPTLSLEATESNSLNQSLVCCTCSQNFLSSESLLFHRILAHDDKNATQELIKLSKSLSKSTDIVEFNPPEPNTCPLCHKVFRTPAKLKKHIAWHKGEKPFTCKICQKSFTRKENLKQHQQIHGQKHPYPCESCGESFRRRAQLRFHKVQVHGMKLRLKDLNRQAMQILPTGEKKTVLKHFLCHKCGQSFPSKWALKEHEQTSHQGRTRLHCLDCGRSFKQRPTLITHMQEHLGTLPYQCSHCESCFATVTKLLSHERSHMSGVLSIMCPKCGRLFASPHLLRSHMYTHTGERPYACNICGKKFSHPTTLKTHKRTHTGDKPFKCTQCSAAFTQRSSLKYHLQSHRGEKPYSCHICGKSYTRMGTLNIHLSHHAGQKLVGCSLCDYTCDTPRLLRKHAAKVHQGSQAEVVPIRKYTKGRPTGAVYADSILKTKDGPTSGASATTNVNTAPPADVNITNRPDLNPRPQATQPEFNAGLIQQGGFTFINRTSGDINTAPHPPQNLNGPSFDTFYQQGPANPINHNNYCPNTTAGQISTDGFGAGYARTDMAANYGGMNPAQLPPVNMQDHGLNYTYPWGMQPQEADQGLAWRPIVEAGLGFTSDRDPIWPPPPQAQNVPVKQELQFAGMKPGFGPQPGMAGAQLDGSVLSHVDMSNSGATHQQWGWNNTVYSTGSYVKQDASYTTWDMGREKIVETPGQRTEVNNMGYTQVPEQSSVVPDASPAPAEEKTSWDVMGSDHIAQSEPASASVDYANATDYNEDGESEPTDSAEIKKKTKKPLSEKKKSKKKKLKKKNKKKKEGMKVKFEVKDKDSEEKKEDRPKNWATQPASCPVCGKWFTRAGNLPKHLKLHAGVCPHTCPICGNKFPRTDYLKLHMKTAHPSPDADVSMDCIQCSEIFKDVKTLGVHVDQVHNGVRPFCCNICSFTSLQLADLKIHVRYSHKALEIFNFQCALCLLIFPKGNDLKDHISSSHSMLEMQQQKPEGDHQTNQASDDEGVLQTHQGLMEQPLDKQEPVEEELNVPNGVFLYQCGDCGRRYRKLVVLGQHMSKRHSIDKRFRCGICQITYQSAHELARHMLNHSGAKPHTCDRCGKAFADWHQLRKHLIVHTDLKPYVCATCGHAFRERNSLIAHERTHTGERPFKCRTCDAAFAQRSSLIYHERSHQGIKPYMCSKCGKSFTRPNTLNTHMRAHAGLRKWACRLCGQMSDRRKFMSKHVLRAHPGVSEADVIVQPHLHADQA